MEEIKPVVTEKYDFENRDESKTIKTPFNFWDYRDFDVKIKLNDFSIKSYSPTLDFWIETLMKRIKILDTEKKWVWK